MEEIVAVFIHEAREQLVEMERGLMHLQQADKNTHPDPELINAIFRAAHTIKGASGVVEIHVIEHFTHGAENVLDQVRNGTLLLSDDLIADLLSASDHLVDLLDAVERGESGEDGALAVRGEEIGKRLKAHLDTSGSVDLVAESIETATSTVIVEDSDAVSADTWHISVRFAHDILKNGMEPLAFLRYLLSLGEIAHITTMCDAMPPVAEMDPENCYLGFEINLRSHAEKAAIEQVFQFVLDQCDLHILPPHSRIADYVRLIEQLPEEPLRIGEILVGSGAITSEELNAALRLQHDEANESAGKEGKAASSPIGSILVEQRNAHPELVEAAVVKQKLVTEKKAADARLIRVQADKLDQLIDLVGELVIAGASASLIAQKSGQTTLVEATSILTRLVENIRDSALQLRMVQIGDTFNRFHRVVRDVSRELGKDIELVITGGETELDKSVVEKIGDPLMHLVRNAVDHGIEPADVRTAAGKSLSGRIELNAYHDSGSIVIEVGDDGGGLNRAKIVKKAVERGLVPGGDALSDDDILNLIFQPGFSTAEQVSNLSGRGVGMDVVRKNIQALRGSVDVRSTEGVGSRFIIRLPLTLAIIDGFLVGVRDSAFVIPLEMVVECLELQQAAVDRNYLNLRGEVLPFVRLRELFEVPGEKPKRENVVVVRAGAQKAGIVVDVLHGEFQTVIKPLGALFRHLRGIAGSTILGSGDVALILDVQALAQLAASQEARALAAPVG